MNDSYFLGLYNFYCRIHVFVIETSEHERKKTFRKLVPRFDKKKLKVESDKGLSASLLIHT